VGGSSIHRVFIVYGGIGRTSNHRGGMFVGHHFLHAGDGGVQPVHDELFVGVVEGGSVFFFAGEGRAARRHFTNVTVHRLLVVC